MENESDLLLIADYGRSGQGWLSYMLCYILNATYVEPYDFQKGVKYSTSDVVLRYTRGRLEGREKTKYALVIKTHGYPALNFNLTEKVVYLTRDPRDVAVSWHFMNIANTQGGKNEGPQRFRVKGIKCFARSLLRVKLFSFLLTATMWRKHVAAWQRVNCYHVRYEDVSDNPEKVLCDLLDYLAVPIDLNNVREAVKKFSFENVAKRKQGDERLLNPEFRKGIVGDYKNHMSKFHISLFGMICGKAASKFGYRL
jgi:hypothetical protein